jgi:hypothetical protein
MPSGGARIAQRQRPWMPRKNRFRQIDGRLYEGKLERRTVRDLTAHLGGDLTAPQQILVEQAAKLVVVLDILAVEMITKGDVGDFTSRRYLAWVGHLRRTLEALGLQRPQQTTATLKAYVGGKAA